MGPANVHPLLATLLSTRGPGLRSTSSQLPPVAHTRDSYEIVRRHLARTYQLARMNIDQLIDDGADPPIIQCAREQACAAHSELYAHASCQGK